MKPKAVVFDIGNVLIGWDPEGFYDRVIGPERRRALFSAVDLHGMNLRIDGGALFRETIFETAAAHPAHAPEIRLWYERWDEIAAPVIHEAVSLRDALRTKGIPVFALTNFGRWSWQEALPRLPFLAGFDRLFISGEIGLLKPDPAIYAHVETVTGLSGPDFLFTDDRADNITAAARRGWRTHQFESWQGWAARLVAEELLSAEEARI